MTGDKVRRESGFTLIELMIVVGIIVILAALALPALFRSRLQSNEASAVENLRTICSAQITYHGAKYVFGDFETLTALEGDERAPFLDGNWAQNVEKSGYTYALEEVSAANFFCYADPVEHQKTGVRYYLVDASGIIHWNDSERPTTDDPVLGTKAE